MLLMFLILCSIVILLLVAVLKDLTGKKEVEKEEELPIVAEEVNLTEEERGTLFDLVSLYDDSFIQYDGTMEPLAMTTEEKLDFVYRLNNTEKKEWNIDWDRSVSLAKINSILESYFGKGAALTTQDDYLCPLDQLPLLIYDDITESYTLDLEDHGHGPLPFLEVENYYQKGEKKEDIYTIQVKKAFSNLITDPSFVPMTYYATYTDAVFSQNQMFDLYAIYGEDALIDTEEKVKRQYLEHKEKFPIYTYVFQKEGDSFYLLELTKE